MLLQYGLLLAGWLSASAQATETIELYLSEAPPLTFQYYHNGHGIAGDMALAAIINSGWLSSIPSTPWNRAQKTVAQGRNLLITPLLRTPEREDQYTWIAPIMSLERAFFPWELPSVALRMRVSATTVSLLDSVHPRNKHCCKQASATSRLLTSRWEVHPSTCSNAAGSTPGLPVSPKRSTSGRKVAKNCKEARYLLRPMCT
jgi:hypothetical protein